MTVALAEQLPPSLAAPDSPMMADPGELELTNNQFALAVRLAALLCRPTDYVDDALCQIGPFEPTQVKAIARHPTFRQVINRAIADNIGLATFKVDKKMMSRLFSLPASRLAAVITTAPMTEIRQVAWIMAAIGLSKRVRALVLKTDRELAREVLGAEAFDVATHEASVLHPALSELDARGNQVPLYSQESDNTARQNAILEFGLQIVGRFLDAAEPILGELFALRLPPSVDYSKRNQVVRAFGDIHREQFLKLIRRRQQSWAAFID